MPETLSVDDSGFMRDADPGGGNDFIVFRRQRSLDTPFNTIEGKKVRPGLYGDNLGFTNIESALRGASGHIDASKFEFNVVYRIPGDLDILDLRPILSRKEIGLRALAASVEWTGGIPGVTSRVFNRALQEHHDGLIVNRTLAQKTFSPFVSSSETTTDNRRLRIKPAWLLVHPDKAIEPIAYRNRKE